MSNISQKRMWGNKMYIKFQNGNCISFKLMTTYLIWFHNHEDFQFQWTLVWNFYLNRVRIEMNDFVLIKVDCFKLVVGWIKVTWISWITNGAVLTE